MVEQKTSKCWQSNPSLCRIHGTAPGVKAYEKIQNFTQLPPERYSKDAETISHLPLKKLSPLGLALTLIHQVKQDNVPSRGIEEALLLAAEVHQHDKRANRGPYPTTAYIEHPLRNTVRAMRFGVKDRDIIIGSLLHDTVEDHPYELARKLGVKPKNEEEARHYALIYLQKQFGVPVRKMVAGMSNPITVDKYTPAEIKNKIYAEHVQEAIQDPHVFVAKICDFIDNATSLHHTETGMNPTGIYKRATKYLPVCDIILNRIEKAKQEPNFPVSRLGLERMEAQIKQGKVKLARLQQKYAKN